MDFEDFLQPEVGVAAAVVAVVASPQVRNVIRKGAVYGLAGVLMAGDAVGAFARGVSQGARNGAASASQSTSANGATATEGQAEGQTEGQAGDAFVYDGQVSDAN